ncbi:MAG: Rrf2 family transcriptional regulator [Phycisphaerales bacterium]|nr:Rrf2 family transcriptional regulator [Phycisphaerae bacterium]NNM27865.1 Rrf2 family transcriptional regulator [Phycisphaerales bacterium]
MSRLAEVYDGGTTLLSAAEIAESRGLQKPFVAKLLSTLSTAGLVNGTRGPGGGFTLARDPRKITLQDVFVLFEREDESLACPFGGGVCGVGDPRPLHDKLVNVKKTMDELLLMTKFEVFRVAYQDDERRPTKSRRTKTKKKKRSRDSYRATRGRS